MTTGEKIKRIRQHRKMTQKELGDAVGLPANRIAQYEMGYRVPKTALLEKMAEALAVPQMALKEPDTGNLGGIMETLFWLDEDMPGVFLLTQVTAEGEPPSQSGNPYEGIFLRGNAVIPVTFQPPTALWSENGLLNRFFREWSEKQKAYFVGNITREEYFEWKISWTGGFGF